MSDFLFHEVSETEKEKIKKEAKQIMDRFSKKLQRIGKKLEEPLIDREKSERDDGEEKCNEIDRKIMFENAPNKNENFIIAEKKSWREERDFSAIN